MLKKMEQTAYKYFHSSKGSHDWTHTQRVRKLCLHIGKTENADLEILSIATLLHDIGRHHEYRSKGRICHAKQSVKMARKILFSFDVNEEKTDRILHCIETHRFRDNNIPESPEAKVLFDSDKLDSIGAVGIGRAFLFAGEVGAVLHNPGTDLSKTRSYSKDDTAWREFSVKLQNVKDRMLTPEGLRLAQERHNFMVKFFERLNAEWQGDL